MASTSRPSRPKRGNWTSRVPEKSEETYSKATQYELKPRFNYIGYDLYFAEKDPEKVKLLAENSQTFESYIHRNIKQFNLEEIFINKFFTIDLRVLYKDYTLMNEWETFRDDLTNFAERTINIMSLAMHQIVHVDLKEKNENCPMHIIYCRLLNYVPIMQIKHLRVNTYGKLVSVKGTIIKASNIGLKCIQIEYKCKYCNGTQIERLIDGIYNVPEKCATKGCGKRNFEALLKSPHTLNVCCQHLKCLELIGEESDTNGRVPRNIECEICDDLVGKYRPGDDVILTGVLNVKQTNEERTSYNRTKAQHSIHELFLKVNNIQTEKSLLETMAPFNIQELLKKIREEQNIFRFLVQSLCPTIYGHEMVKAGLLLALFGGTKTSTCRRSDCHVLIVGDPGLGKSQMLQACCNVAPRGIYVCGNTSTNAGLTVTMSKEANGEYRLEAGAMVLADQGCCCIDEFDKMTKQHACLLEVMEQQTISIAKAGVLCNLPTRASVLAAANPVCGHYNKAKTVSENLKISSPLLSRFDLVFIILDKPNERVDAMLAENVLALRSGEKPNSMAKDNQDGDDVLHDLKDRLRLYKNETIDYLPATLLKRYIAHAKQFIQPELSPEASSELKKFYLQLRKEYHKGDSTPVTPRQLESLLRLTQARAKLELRNIATAQDALDVIEIMKHCIMNVFTDDLGTLDFTRTQNGAGISNQKLAKLFLKALQRNSDMTQKNKYNMKELRTFATKAGIPGQSFQGVFDSINLQGFLLKKGADDFHFTICD